MLRRHACSIFVTLTVLWGTASLAFAQTIPGQPGPPEGVLPVVMQPGHAGPSINPPVIFQTPLGFEVSLQHYEDLKRQSPPPFPLGGSQIIVDPNKQPPAPSGNPLFSGPTPNGWIPYDAAVAVGPSHILALVNAKWVVYDKTSYAKLSETTFDSWWNTSASNPPFDPKCYYDPSGHFVMIATWFGSGLANMYVSVSQTSDPTGDWWNYTYDWRLDGTTSTGNWGDYPGLGYDDNAIYINANQYSLSSNFFQYSKVRVLDKAQLFSGTKSTYTDFIDLRNADGTAAFTVKPARCLSSTASEYLLNTRPGGGSSVTLWSINPLATPPTLTRVATVSVGSYAVPPDAPQAGGRNLVATGDCRTQDVVWRNGVVYTAFTEKVGTTRKNQASALRYLEVTNTGGLNSNITYKGASGIYFYYPAVTAADSGNVAMVFNRSSSTEYISMYSVKKPSGATAFDTSTSQLLAAGNTYMRQSRWGDYNAIHNDDVSGGAWLMAGTGRSYIWATDIAFVSLP
jgi:hypothetical protein